MPMQMAGLIGRHGDLQRAADRQGPRPRWQSGSVAARHRADPPLPPASAPASRPPRPGRNCAWICAARRSDYNAPRRFCHKEGTFLDVHCSSVSRVTVTEPSVVHFAVEHDHLQRGQRRACVTVGKHRQSGRSSSGSSMPNLLSAKAARVATAHAGAVLSRSSARAALAAQTPCSGTAAPPLISNEGFSVVAPIKMMLPFSTKGRNASCCALLKLMDLIDEHDGAAPP